MTNRYENLDTHIIDTSKSSTTSREFQSLADLNVVGKIPVSNGDVFVFTIDTNNNLNYARVKNTNNESYEAQFRVISPEVSFEGLTNIKVVESYYEKEKLFYVIFNKGADLFLRTFHNETFLGEELPIAENVTLYRLERIKENYMMVVSDNTHLELFESISSLGTGEFKFLFLFENDIQQFEGKKADVMNIQLLDIPFGDIGENNWTDENLVQNNKGYLYMTNPEVVSVFNDKSINGSVFQTPYRTVLELNKDATEYTFTMRFSFSYLNPGFQQLLNTENYRVRCNDSDFVIETIDGDQTITIPGGISTGTFYNISMTSAVVENKYILKCHVSNEDMDNIETFTITSDTLPTEVDKIMIIDNIEWLDYLAVQNIALYNNAVNDLHCAFEKKTLSRKEKRSLNISHNDLNGITNNNPDIFDLPFFEEQRNISNISITVNTTLDVPWGAPYIDNEDGTIADVTDNLMWSQEGIVEDEIWNNMQARNSFLVSQSSLAGHTDWRLPTLPEAQAFGDALDDPNTEGLFDLDSIYNNTEYPGEIWTSSQVISGASFDIPIPPSLIGESISGVLYFSYNLISKESSMSNVFFDDINNIMQVRDYADFTIEYENSSDLHVPVLEGETKSSSKTDYVKFRRNVKHPSYDAYNIDLTYDIETIDEEIEYPNHYKLNTALEYRRGRYYALDYKSPPQDLQGTVLPLYFDPSEGIDIYTDKENSIRISQNLSQKFARLPFIMETAGDLEGFVLWTNASAIGKQMGLQYNLNTDDIGLRPTFQEYETLSYNTYPFESYWCAYHFTQLKENRRALIKEVTIDNQGEIIVGGDTEKNSYLREIVGMNFFDNPKRYKSSEFNVSVDVLRNVDRESYINNVKDIKLFISEIIDYWKPAQASVRNIVEKNTLVMAQLLKDEFTQVLVGLTPRSNTNAFYLRSSENGQISAVTSSNSFGDEIDWLGIGTLDTPYVKSGVTKIKTKRQQTKIFFETRFANNSYRVFVFSPNNTNYFVPVRDKDGFIVESSSFVEDEVAWIALDTNQVINGTLKWNKGIPQAQPIKDHLNRQQEININSSRYRVDISSEGFTNFQDDTYSVILTPNSNINLWVENKQLGTFDIRRSYAGNDTEVHYMAVKGATKWWEDITA